MSVRVEFGDFLFDAETGVLAEFEKKTVLGGRAAAILGALIGKRGECVSNQDLLKAAWPNIHVDEANIRVHIAKLRRVFGKHDYIINEPGRGYRFVASLVADPVGDTASATSDYTSDARFLLGDCQFDFLAGILIASGQQIQLGSRAAILLHTLIQRRGHYVSNGELLHAGWPNEDVSDANIRVHIAVLRKILGESQGRCIVNIPGRGYQLVLPVLEIATSIRDPVRSEPQRTYLASKIALAPMRLVGRAKSIKSVVEAIKANQIVTLVGTAGVGKTSLAIAAAQRWELKAKGEAIFVDFGAVFDPRHVALAVATSLSIHSTSEDSSASIVRDLNSRNALLIFDNCEHLTAEVASLAEMLLERTEAKLMATSREPLRIRGEQIELIEPLRLPPDGAALSAAEALSYSAIELFVQRANASTNNFHLSDENARDVAVLCRRLDGLPLALEFAAARLDSLDIKTLTTALDERFKILTRGRTTAPTRQATLRATLDWSYNQLDPRQSAALRRLSVFSGYFAISDAAAVASVDGDLSGSSMLDVIADLVAKSLVTVEFRADDVSYRLLETIRAYAREKLAAADETDHFRAKHAKHHIQLFRGQNLDWDKPPPHEIIEFYRSRLDDIRSGIDWAFSERGDKALAIALTAASAPMWFHIAVLYEYHTRLRFALEQLQRWGTRDDQHEMELQCALAVSLFTSGHLFPEMATAGARALHLSQALNSTTYALRALWALIGASTLKANYAEALLFAEQFRRVALKTTEKDAHLASLRIMGLQSMFVGRHKDANQYCMKALEANNSREASDRNAFVYDHMAVARGTLARTLWLQGRPDDALRASEQAVEEVLATGQAASVAFVLAVSALPVAFWSGAWDVATERVEIFCAHVLKHDFRRWQDVGRLYQWALTFVSNEDERFVFDPRQWKPPSMQQLEVFGSIHPSLVQPDALGPIDLDENRWSAPEMLRTLGEQEIALHGENGFANAASLFKRSAAIAARQGALSWELRTATSIARLNIRQGLSRAATDVLKPVLRRFTQGFDTIDVRRARTCLDSV